MNLHIETEKSDLVPTEVRLKEWQEIRGSLVDFKIDKNCLMVGLTIDANGLKSVDIPFNTLNVQLKKGKRIAVLRTNAEYKIIQ